MFVGKVEIERIHSGRLCITDPIIGTDFHQSENRCQEVPENQRQKNKDTDHYLPTILFGYCYKLETHFISPIGTDFDEVGKSCSAVTEWFRSWADFINLKKDSNLVVSSQKSPSSASSQNSSPYNT